MADGPLGDVVSGKPCQVNRFRNGVGSFGPFWNAQKFWTTDSNPTFSFSNPRTVNCANTLGGITISFWMQSPRVVAQTLLQIQQSPTNATVSITCGLNGSNQLQIVQQNGSRSRTSNEAMGANQACHYVATVDSFNIAGASLHLYLNGVECSYLSTVDGTSINPCAGPLSIAPTMTAGSMMTDLRIYDYIMNPGQVYGLWEKTEEWLLYAKPKMYLDVSAAPVVSFLPRLALLGAG